MKLKNARKNKTAGVLRGGSEIRFTKLKQLKTKCVRLFASKNHHFVAHQT